MKEPFSEQSSLNAVFRQRFPERPWLNDLSILWLMSKPYTLRVVAAALCSLLLSGINGAIAWSTKSAVDDILILKKEHYQYLLPVGVVLLFVFRGLFSFCNNYLMASIGAKIVRTLRQAIFDKILSLPMSFHIKSSSGNVVSKMLNDVGILQGTVGFTIKDLLVESSTVLVLAAVAFYRRWDLALLSFTVIPLMVYSIGRLGVLMKRTGMQTRLLIARITTIITESLLGIKIIKAFTMEDGMREKNERALVDHYRNAMRETRINEFSSLVTDILGGVGVAGILFYGFSLVVSDKMTPGDFFSFIVAVTMMYTPLKRLSRIHNNFQQGRNVLDRIKEIVVVDGEKPDGERISVAGDVKFDDVSFRYPGAQTDALQHISCSIRHGEIIALVGYSGAGKSTFADLVAGFWYPTAGHLFIDEKDVHSLSLLSLRAGIGTVTQDVMLFDDTVKANILFGRPGATDADIIAAAKAAFAHDFITELPEGYETNIGERGVRLSGGQKQRITIARAILRNPGILILDEATSSLDTESEHQVQKALEVLMQNRTTIVIAHRLSTIRRANRIYVMSQGRIVQEGTHDQLLAQNGLYRELYAMQFRTDESEPDYTRQ
ncbi:MAG TPA: ABC transporter ATP-binding protein [Dissulfurispiraceae bacterium]|nr:ABC transporter ATP-binding protein [Dissulfurispiraceae bacterium]